MKKFIIACAAAAVLVSLPACTSTGTNAASSAPNRTQQTVPFPDNPGTSTLPTATPNLPNPE
jgi:hypothetical protein